MTAIRKRGAAETIARDELLLHVEPVLNEAAAESGAQGDARRIVNEIELAIFTQIEPLRTNLILKLSDDAIRLSLRVIAMAA